MASIVIGNDWRAWLYHGLQNKDKACAVGGAYFGWSAYKEYKSMDTLGKCEVFRPDTGWFRVQDLQGEKRVFVAIEGELIAGPVYKVGFLHRGIPESTTLPFTYEEKIACVITTLVQETEVIRKTYTGSGKTTYITTETDEKKAAYFPENLILNAYNIPLKIREPKKLEFADSETSQGEISKEVEENSNGKRTITRSYSQKFFRDGQKVTIIGELSHDFNRGFELHPPEDGKPYLIIRSSYDEFMQKKNSSFIFKGLASVASFALSYFL